MGEQAGEGVREDRIHEALVRMAAHIAPPGPDRALAVGALARMRIARNSIAAAVAASIVALSGVAAVRALDPQEKSSPVTPASQGASGRPVEVSATNSTGQIRCTASLQSDVVVPGELPGVRFVVQNVGPTPVKYRRWSPRIVVRDENGSELWDPDGSLGFRKGGPPIPPRTLAPGASIEHREVKEAAIRWAGPLQLEPLCSFEGGPGEMEPLRVRVAAEGEAPALEAALDAALAKTGNLLERCPFRTDGQWARGELVRPAGRADLPALTARCSAVVERHPGFTVVELRIVSPEGAPELEFPTYIGAAVFSGLPGTGSMQIARWVFVVTQDAVRDATGLDAGGRTRADATNTVAPGFSLENGVWSLTGETACGGTGNGFTWISVCPP